MKALDPFVRLHRQGAIWHRVWNYRNGHYTTECGKWVTDPKCETTTYTGEDKVCAECERRMVRREGKA